LERKLKGKSGLTKSWGKRDRGRPKSLGLGGGKGRLQKFEGGGDPWLGMKKWG